MQSSTYHLFQAAWGTLKPARSVPVTAIIPPQIKLGTKRSAPTDVPSAMSEEEAEAMLDRIPIDKSCNQVWTQIRNFIEAGGMKIGEFQKAIGVSSKSYLTFMDKNGPSGGTNTATYDAAWAFFKKRELMGISMPKRAKTAATSAPAPTAGMVGRAAAMPSVAGNIDTAKTGPLSAYQLSRVELLEHAI